MPNINVLKNSRFLKKEDCMPPILVTITGCTEENMAKEGAPEELRWCLHFAETDKPCVLNSTNGQIIAGLAGSDNTDDWLNRKIVLYADPNVSFGGKLIGGIRARAPRQPQPAKQTLPDHTPPHAQPLSAPATLPPSQHPPAAQPPAWPTTPETPETDDVPF